MDCNAGVVLINDSKSGESTTLAFKSVLSRANKPATEAYVAIFSYDVSSMEVKVARESTSKFAASLKSLIAREWIPL